MAKMQSTVSHRAGNSRTTIRTLSRGGRSYISSTKLVWSKDGSWASVTTEERTPNLIGLVILALLVASLFSIFTGTERDFSFLAFLEMLQNAPMIPLDWLFIPNLSFTLPNFLFWVEPILNFLFDMVNLGSFVFTGILNCLRLILYLLRWVIGI